METEEQREHTIEMPTVAGAHGQRQPRQVPFFGDERRCCALAQTKFGLYDAGVSDDERWTVLDRHLRQTGSVAAERAHGLTLIREKRAVVIDRATVLDEQWLILRTPVCDEKDLDPRAVHERNGQLAIAAMVVESGRYLFRVAVPLRVTDVAALDRLIALSFDAAKRLRPFRSVEGDPNAALDFAYFTE